ncbi:MAG TPA: DUF1987 domain-containing protein [Salinivirgaceae bacterium]|nr:DUF1987 domain-containing protein [Salinivirgaceae bacterium]
METIIVEQTHTSPKIHLDGENGVITLSGRSIPDNAMKVYRPVIDWIEKYLVFPKPRTTINIDLTFFNTSSSKYLLEILKMFEAFSRHGFIVEVNWYYHDEDVQDLIKDYQALVDLDIKCLPAS